MAKALRRARSAPAAKPHKKNRTSTKKPRTSKVATSRKLKQAPSSAAPQMAAPIELAAPSRSPNMLVTIDERHRARAGEEILTLLGRAGYSNCQITESPGTGLVGVYIEAADSRTCIPRLKEILMDTPFAFQHTHRWLPVESWAAEAAELEKFAKLAGAEIGSEASWGIVVERHNSALDRGLIVN